jgi:hypothetical protein
MKRDLYNKVNKKYQHTKKLSVMLRTKFFFGMITLMLGTNIFLTNCTFQQKGNVGNSLGKNDKEKEKPENIAYEIPKILPPLKGIDVPFKTYKVEGNKEQKIVIEETGTIINIPANAFVDKNGNPVSGPLEIKFREFHNAGDVILSGIPMVDPVTGKNMETAGMFEIRGNASGNEIFIKDDKNIEVKLASFNEGNHFDFFQFDESTGRWETLEKNKEPEINLVKVEKLRTLDCNAPKKPVKPVKRGSNKNLVFELNFNYKKFPELEMFRNVAWQFAGKPGDADNPEKMEAFDSKWSDISLKKADGYYDLTLKTKDNTINTRVLPLLASGDYEQAMKEFDKKVADFEKIKDVHNKRREIAQMNADFLRTAEISNFGVFNHDCWRENDAVLQVNVDFDVQYDHLEKMKSHYYLINRNNKAIVNYYDGMKTLRYTRGMKNKLIAILPDNKVAVFSENDFVALEKKNLKNGEHFTLKMPTANVEIKKPQDLYDILAMD